jgi:hypothetical protein
VDNRIAAEENKLETLIMLKAAMSQGLLTGKIPASKATTQHAKKGHQRKGE